MVEVSRRSFFRIAGAGGAAAVVGSPALAETAASISANGVAVLVDSTLCLGCRGCEVACSEANDLPEPADDNMEVRRTTTTQALTVVNRYELESGDDRYVKIQCMHCLEPACASACLVRALEKTSSGAVVYHADRCLGCRYCMISCQFDVPRFEYEKAVPLVRKCSFCAGRQASSEAPACVEACPAGALAFGRRSEMLLEAKKRVFQEPDRYVHHVYGEREAGGTSWLYIGDAPFERLGLPAVGERSNAEAASGALAAVPLVMTLWPTLLVGLWAINRRRTEIGEEAHHG
jgi:formate dehydrogenase iron-sulfur subunit